MHSPTCTQKDTFPLLVNQTFIYKSLTKSHLFILSSFTLLVDIISNHFVHHRPNFVSDYNPFNEYST